ncbi:MAG TPA: neutral zinc metallopeptidase [Pyrinomonadaceae bacterium]
MRWRGERESDNVEDRRGMSGGGGRIAVGGGLGTLIVIIIAVLFGADPRQLLQQAPTDQPAPTSQSQRQGGGQEDDMKKFVSVVLGKTEDVWQDIFRQNGKQYRDPTLVLFTDQVQSACGSASSASGPFYCPGDQKVYIDLSFYEELRRRFHSPGDFAQAYVIAHEVGHHVQKLLGISDRVEAMQRRASEVEGNKLSVRLELQADFFAGVWARYVQKQGLLEEGDIEEALNAASAIGDDAIQRQSTGHVVPDSFTHGTSEQRIRWFKKGFDTGDIRQGDTFSAPSL